MDDKKLFGFIGSGSTFAVAMLALICAIGTPLMFSAPDTVYVVEKEEDPFGPVLINGRPAKAGEFPEAVYVNFGGGRCTASVVGPDSLLSAAHCMRNGASGTFQLGQNQYRATNCRHHPSYPRTDIDLAICKISKDVDVAYAVIPPEDFGLQKGDKIRIVGYGCVRPGGGGGNDGILRVGDATVSGFSGHDIVSGGAGLCFGDSGGPAYVTMEDNFSEVHVQVSVNSKGNIRNTNYTARTYNKTARDFLTKWTEEFGTEICGINKDCGGGVDPNKCPVERDIVGELRSDLSDSEKILAQCLRD